MASIIDETDSKSGSVGIVITDSTKAEAIIKALNDGPISDIWKTLNPKETLQPASINAYLRYLKLDDEGKTLLVAALKKADPVKTGNVTNENIIDVLLNSKKVKSHFTSAKEPYVERPLEVNPNTGFSLALANPLVAQIINDERARKAKLMLIRNINVPAMPPYGGLFGNSGISILMRGGAAAASAMQPPSFKYPIEMRGGGYDIAMSGGNHFPFWQAPNNTYFISTQLKSALNTVRAALKSQNLELSKENDVEVEKLLTELKKAEEAVITERNKYNSLVNGIRSGEVKLKDETGTKVISKDKDGNDVERYDESTKQVVKKSAIDDASTAYNAAVLNARKIEKKVFNVLIAIGGKQVYPPRG